MRQLILILALFPLFLSAQTIPNPPSSGGGGSAAIACAGTPGNTVGAYRQQCQTSGGAIYACNNAASCTLSADWISVTGSGSFTYPSSTGLVTVSGGAAWGTTVAAPTGAIVGVGQTNAFGAFLQDFSLSTVKIPTAAGFTATASSMFGYDSTAGFPHIWFGAADKTFGTAAFINTGTSGGTLGLLNGNLTFSGGNAYGTPASITLTNATGLPNASVIGLGTAALVNTGTSAGTLCLLNGNCTFSGSNAYGTPASITLTNGTGLPNASVIGLGTAALINTGTSAGTLCLLNANCTRSGNETLTAKLDASGGTHTLPTIVVASSGSLPATCTAGELAFVTGATAGQNVYECGSTNTWTQQLNSGGGGGGSNALLTSVGFSATPTFTVTASTTPQIFSMTLTGNVTGSTLTASSATAGQQIGFILTQDATGGRTFVWPTNVLGACTIDPVASVITTVIGTWNGTNVVTPSCTTNDTWYGVQSPTSTTTPTPVSGSSFLYTATSTGYWMISENGGTAVQVPGVSSTPTNGNCADWVVSSGQFRLGDAGSPCGSGGGGGSTLTETWLALGSVSANTLVCVVSATQVSTCTTGTTIFYGVATNSVSTGGSVTVQRAGQATVVAGNTTMTVGDAAGVSPLNAGAAYDLGAARSSASSTYSTAIILVGCTSCTVGTTTVTIALVAEELGTQVVLSGAGVFGQLPGSKGGTGVSNTATLTLGSSNQNWATLGTGIVKNTTTTGALSDATAADMSAINYVTGGGSANAQTATYSPAIASLVNGLSVCWLPTAANTTTTPTFSPNSLTAKTLTKAGGTALAASDLTTTAVACGIYDGTNWELQNPQTSAGGSGNTTSTSLTTSHLPKANGANSIIDSSVVDNGTTVSTTEPITTPSLSTGTSPPSVTPGTAGVGAFGEGTVPSVCAASAVDCIYASSTLHGFLVSLNNGGYVPLVTGPASVTSNHFGLWSAEGVLSDLGADFVWNGTHSITAGASGILDMSAATGTAALKVPTTTTNTATAAGVIDYDPTNSNYHAYSGADSLIGIVPTASVPTNGHIIDASVSSGKFLLHDSNLITANVVTASSPGAGLCHFAGSTQACTSSAVTSADATGNTSGSGNFVLVTSATLVTPALGTPSSGVATNLTGLPIAAIVNGTQGGLVAGGGSGNQPQVSAAGTALQIALSGGTGAPTFIDFPERYYVPAANCNNTTAGAGWSVPAGGTVGCRGGTNNLGGFITITDTSSTFAQFTLMLPNDWDSATRPYIRFYFSSASDTTNGHTVIPQVKVSCPTAANGTTSDDATFSAAQSSSTVTFGASAVANGFYNGSNVQFGSTQMTGCIAGGMMIVQVGRATDTATGNVNFYGADVTFPRLLAVGAQ